MSQPITKPSVEAATGTATGTDVRSLGHVHVTLFVTARNLDTGNDTLTVGVEGSPNRQNWANLGEANSAKKLSESDFTEDPDNAGTYTASVTATAAYHEFLRARIEAFTDSANGDLEVDAWVMAAGNPGQGRKGTSRKGGITE